MGEIYKNTTSRIAQIFDEKRPDIYLAVAVSRDLDNEVWHHVRHWLEESIDDFMIPLIKELNNE